MDRDAPEIIADCMALADVDIPASRIPGALHRYIFLLEQTFAAVREQIRAWYGTGA